MINGGTTNGGAINKEIINRGGANREVKVIEKKIEVILSILDPTRTTTACYTRLGVDF